MERIQRTPEEKSRPAILDPAEFYDELGDPYDEMTRMHERMESETQVLRKWIEKYRPEYVLDAACGTGLHTIILTKLGIDTVGLDISESMIDRARRNASAAGIDTRFIRSDILEFFENQHRPADMILFLGNSLPHILDSGTVTELMKGFRKMLHPDGIIVIQLLNFAQILSSRKRIVAINRHQDREFVRFYDFIDPLIRFNILQIDWLNDRASERLISTELYPYRLDELNPLIRPSGLSVNAIYGNMRFETYDPESSPNLVMVLRHSGWQSDSSTSL